MSNNLRQDILNAGVESLMMNCTNSPDYDITVTFIDEDSIDIPKIDYFKSKSRRASRRKKAKQVFVKKKAVSTYSYSAPFVDWGYVDGKWTPVGKYIKYHNDQDIRKWAKTQSNRKLRRSKLDTVPAKGNGYRKVFDYWWTLY